MLSLRCASFTEKLKNIPNVTKNKKFRQLLLRRPNFDNFQSVIHNIDIDRVLHQGSVVSLVTLVCLGPRLALLKGKSNVSSNFLNPEGS